MKTAINDIKVCILSSVHNALDTRIFYKEAKTLAGAGYNVTLIAQYEKVEYVDGIKIIPLKKHKSRFQRITVGIYTLFVLAIKEGADIYHLHDPELVFTGLALKLMGKKVVYDIHELVYFQIEDKYWLKNKVVKFLCKKTYLVLEKVSFKFFDKLILAEDGYEDYYKQVRNWRRYNIVRNVPIISFIDSVNPAVGYARQKPIIIYAGVLSELRGTKDLIKSMEFIKGNAELWLLGRWEAESFKKKCESLEGWEHTKYLGVVSLHNVYRYMKGASIGVATLYPVKNYLTSLPVKTFEYMTCKLPMVISNFPYWEEIFKKCALFVNPEDPEDIADKLNYLLGNRHLMKELGENGRRLIENKYSWEMEITKLLKLYKEIEI
ncbi:MAG: glycosyltransferase [Candidatus Brocadia sp.]|nr:glycosyltransferase [Candidatus Brocadia sp.]